MPSLSLFGQKTCLAGDDLFLSSVLFICLRMLQLAVLIPLSIFASRDKQEEYTGCPDEDVRHNLLDDAYPIFVSYISISYLLVVVGISLEIGICIATGKGTPTQPELRTNVTRLCQVKLILLSLLRIVAILLGLLSAFILKDYCDCIPEPDTIDILEQECEILQKYRTYFLILVSTHCVEAASVAIAVAYFFCKCTPSTPQLASAETKWSVCCHCCMSLLSITTCCCFGGRQVGDYSDIAMVLSDYFNDEGTLDIVTSDIIMALLMLMRVQDERREECVAHVLAQAKEQQNQQQEHAIEEEEEIESFESAKATDDDEDMEGYKDSREVELSSTSSSSSESSVDSAVARLALLELNQASRHKLSESVVFQMDRTDSTGRVYFRPKARVILMAKNPADKLAIAEGARFMRYARAMYSWKMDLIEKPISSCGTFGLQFVRSLCSKGHENVHGDNHFGMNAESLLSFADLEPEQVVYASFSEGLGKIPFCVLIDYEWKSVVISIRGTLSLEDAVTDISISPISLEAVGDRCGFDGRLCYAHDGMLKTCEWVYSELERLDLLDDLLLNEESPFAGYRLRVTGHSLGAGCAAVLSIMLRPRFPDLKGHCFSPPGCVLSEHLAERCKEFLTSYVLGTDIVPRLSQESMENLRDDVLEMIARIKVSKRDAVLASRGRGTETLDELLYSKASIPPSEFHDELNEFRIRYETRKESRTMINVRLSPPGNIIHLVNTGFDASRCPCVPYDSFYTARWIEPEDLREIIISARLLDDHNPLNVLTELELIAANEFDLQSPFTC